MTTCGCLCASWCGVCRDYRAVFDALALEHPQARFVWVDVEDEEDVAGELDVETFPTLLLADGLHARFLGPLLPQGGVLGLSADWIDIDTAFVKLVPEAREGRYVRLQISDSGTGIARTSARFMGGSL